jgi:16S rRNA (guanine527-N7)-methyltransferase
VLGGPVTAADDAAPLCAELGLPCSATQAAQLAQYLALLQRWNATYNLTAVRDPAAMRTQHLADCLALVPALVRRGLTQGRLLDVGSGGGLPGVVLAIMLPGLDVTCVDTVGKKAAFIRQVAGALSLRNLQAAHARVQELRLPPFDLITSRAFASLADFTQWTAAQLKPGGSWLAMKGKLPQEEIAALPRDTAVFHVEHLSVPGLAAERCLVWMQPVRHAAAGETDTTA